MAKKSTDSAQNGFAAGHGPLLQTNPWFFAQLQVRYPDRLALIRGNQESRQITQVLAVCACLCHWIDVLPLPVHGVYDECVPKFGGGSTYLFSLLGYDYQFLTDQLLQLVYRPL